LAARNKKARARKEKKSKEQDDTETEIAALLREILTELRRLNENMERRSPAATAAVAADVATPPAGLQETAADDYDDDENSEDMDEFE
jgi:hypothetical protein